MQVVIVGAGKVGFSLAELLSTNGHDVIVVEIDQDRADAINDKLNVQVIIGNGASPSFQHKINIEICDLLIAVTDTDEANILACMFAKQNGVQITVARVRNAEYALDDRLMKNKSLGIDLFINPEQVTANAITDFIQIPEAYAVHFFEERKVMMIELSVDTNSILIDKALKDLKSNKPFLVTAIIRNERIIVPDGNEIILERDHLYVISKSIHMEEIEKSLGFQRKKASQVMILGGGRLGYYLARNLEPTDINVKILEKNFQRCEKLAEQLDTSIILHGDVSDIDILNDEGINEVDLLIASTEDDKLNVLTCLLGSRLGAKKTIAQIRRSDYLPLIESVGIDAIVSPRLLCCEAIMRFIQKGNLVSMASVHTGSADVYEIIVEEKHDQLANRSVSKINIPRGAIIAAIYRNGEVIIPTGRTVIQVGDHLNMFVTKGVLGRIKKLLK